jgi:hypothetical protein
MNDILLPLQTFTILVSSEESYRALPAESHRSFLPGVGSAMGLCALPSKRTPRF